MGPTSTRGTFATHFGRQSWLKMADWGKHPMWVVPSFWLWRYIWKQFLSSFSNIFLPCCDMKRRRASAGILATARSYRGTFFSLGRYPKAGPSWTIMLGAYTMRTSPFLIVLFAM